MYLTLMEGVSGASVLLQSSTLNIYRTEISFRSVHSENTAFFPPPTDHRSRPQAEGGRQIIARVQEIPSAKEVWFRAAVIAVPIAGGLVLVLLITLALRMLRSENQRLKQQRREMLSRLHYGFHGQHLAKSHAAKLDLECMMPLGGHESCCLTCDKIRQSDLSSQRLLSLVHWGRHSPRAKLELV